MGVGGRGGRGERFVGNARLIDGLREGRRCLGLGKAIAVVESLWGGRVDVGRYLEEGWGMGNGKNKTLTAIYSSPSNC